MEWTHLLSGMKVFDNTFILAHCVTPLKWGWVHSITLGRHLPDADVCNGCCSLDRELVQLAKCCVLGAFRRQR